MHVSDDDSNMFCKFDKSWWTLKKCWNFMIFLGRALSAFFYGISQTLWMGSYFTCMFLMMIQINSASLMKFGDFWKMLKFNHISRAGTVGIFLWKNLTSLKRLKFHMHVSDDDSNMCSASFMKFDEIWKNVEISWYFKGPALSAFFYEISQLLWMGSNFTCMFLMMIQINSASLMKFGELWKNVEISWYL